jgi:CHAT domain-containing protein
MKQHTILIVLLIAAIMLASHQCSYASDTVVPIDQLSELYVQGKFGDILKILKDHPSLPRDKSGGQILDLEILRIRALIGLGKNAEALAELNRLRNSMQKDSSEHQVITLDILSATALAGMGKNTEAEQILKPAVARAKASGNNELAASALNNLLIIYALQGKTDDSQTASQEAFSLAGLAGDKLLTAKLNINLAAVDLSAGRFSEAKNRLSAALSLCTSLKDSYEKSYGLISAADLYLQMAEYLPEENDTLKAAALNSFKNALTVARNINAYRLSSLAAGKIGQMYIQNQMYGDALAMTREALFYAQLENQSDMLYQWQWQAAVILKAQGKIEEAIDMNRLAVQTLQSVRYGFATTDLNFFRKNIKPVYMDLTDMLLKRAHGAKIDVELQSILDETLETIELLRTEELRDYLQGSCIDIAKEKIIGRNSIATNIAVIYYIVFNDRIEAVVSTHSGMRSFQVPESVKTIIAEARVLRSKLQNGLSNFMEPSRKLYDWLVRPLEETFSGSATLIFVTDDILRTIPMAVLHDGSSYLIEKYPIAVTQSLLITESAQQTSFNKTSGFLGGISKSVLSYPALPKVQDELKGIQQNVGGKLLINESFTMPNIKLQLSETSYAFIHIASHGLFSGNVKDTYILTWDGKMSGDLLERFVKMNQFSKTPLDLLTLSACSSAAGDDRASLGLAGIALKAGAKSAIASLWDIDDEATSEFFIRFYSVLKNNPGISKAKALQTVQVSMLKGDLKPDNPQSESRGLSMRGNTPIVSTLIKDSVNIYKHPFFWAPFVLSGNWQ